MEKQIQEIIFNNQLVILKFSKDGCGPCKNIDQALSVVQESKQDLVVHEIKYTEDTVDLFKEYQVKSVPTLCYFKDGTLVQTVLGSKTSKELMDILV